MSHHSNQPNPETQAAFEAMKEQQRRLQGEFPEGRLNLMDQGSVAVMVGHENGKVVMQFPHPTAWIGFTPQQALDIATALIQHARQCSGIVSILELKL